MPSPLPTAAEGVVRTIVVVLILLAAAAAGGFAWWHYAAPAVRVGAPSRGTAVEAVYATGVVEPVTWAKVTPMVRGRLIEHCRCEGEWKKKGDVLARLDDEAQKARISELEAREGFLLKEVDRYRKLLANRDISLQTFERTTSEAEEVRALIAAERERLSDYTLRAPIEGQVLRSDYELGEIVDERDVLFWIGRPKPLWIVADVDEEDIPRVTVDAKALIKADAFPGRVLEGRVERITPKGDPVNKNFRVYVNLPPETPLRIGMTAEVNIVVRTAEDALLIPADAIALDRNAGDRGSDDRTAAGDRVFVIDAGRVQARTIRTGIVGGHKVQVLGGLDADARIVLAPPQGLKDGERVRIEPGPAS